MTSVFSLQEKMVKQAIPEKRQEKAIILTWPGIQEPGDKVISDLTNLSTLVKKFCFLLQKISLQI